MRQIRILLVENDANISEFMAELLGVLGHDVCGTATTESEAIDAAELHAPDLMIVDVWLKVGNGISAMEVINRRIAMPHIFMTGGSRHTLPRDAIVLYKPFGAADLANALETVTVQIAAAAPAPRRL